MPEAGVSLSGYVRLIGRNRNYRRLWLAQIVSEVGDWLYVVALYTLLLQLTGTAKSVALAVVLQVLPQCLVAPMAGVINDRVSRKQVMIAADLIRAVIVLAMLFASHAASVNLIYTLLFLETVMWAFFEPGRSAIVPNITSPDELVIANSLGSITWSMNLALGSGLGGLVAAFMGRDAVFVINAVSFLVSAALLRGITANETHTEGAAKLKLRDLFDFSPVAEGIGYIARDKRLVALMLVKAGLGVLAPHWVLLPIFGERLFPVQMPGLDPQRGAMLGMSALMASRGVGALLGPLVGSIWTGRDQPRLRIGILGGFLLGAVGYLGLAVAPSLWFAVLMVIITHSGSSIGWVFSTTLLQFHADDRFRGRVFSADFAFMVVAMSLASYTAGALVDRGVPVRTVAMLTGFLALVPAVAWVFAMRVWRKPASQTD